MSSIEKIGTQVGNTCVGAFVAMLGDPSGGTLAATGMVGFAAIGAEMFTSSSSRTRARAQKNAISALKESKEFRHVSPDRILELLEKTPANLQARDYIDATRSAINFDLDTQIAKLIYSRNV